MNLLAFNGEIYNYRPLRRTLQDRGETFHTQGEAEVLLAMYRHFGPDMIPMLEGMFAIVIYDPARRGVILARDSKGVCQSVTSSRNPR